MAAVTRGRQEVLVIATITLAFLFKSKRLRKSSALLCEYKPDSRDKLLWIY